MKLKSILSGMVLVAAMSPAFAQDLLIDDFESYTDDAGIRLEPISKLMLAA